MTFAFIPVLLFVAEPSKTTISHNEDRAVKEKPAGLTLIQATASWRFWAMSYAFFLGAVCIHGTLAHVVAMLTDRGLSFERATAALSMAGVAMVFGRVACGWFLDRFAGPSVAVTVFMVAAAGIAVLASDTDSLIPELGTMLCGIGLGALIGLMAFFASRYFGLIAYGQIFGTMFGTFILGSGVGPYMSGLCFDLTDSYMPALMMFSGVLLLAAGLLLPLGPYPFVARGLQATLDKRAADQQAASGSRI